MQNNKNYIKKAQTDARDGTFITTAGGMFN